MAEDLKAENKKHIYWMLALPVLVCGGIQSGSSEIPNNWLTFLAVEGASGALLYVASLLLTNLLPADIKHKIVFTRLNNEMPAGRVHRLVKHDARIEYSAAAQKWPAVFEADIDEATRNSRWYQEIYKPVRDLPSVLQAHRTFLLFRDVTSGLVFLFAAAASLFVLGAFSLTPPLHFSIPLVMLTSGGLTLIVARHSGTRMVVNAVAEAL